DEPRRVVEVLSQPVTPRERLVDERIDLELGLAHRGEDEVLVRDDPPASLPEHALVDEALHPGAEPPGAIGVGRSDATTGRPDRSARKTYLVPAVQRHVVRHDHVGASTDA